MALLREYLVSDDFEEFIVVVYSLFEEVFFIGVIVMPYKTSLPKPVCTGKARSQYRVSNWSSYNESLKNRGSLTLWINDDIKDKWYAPENSTRTRGGQLRYSNFAIMLFLSLRMLFKLPLRQTAGFIKSIFSLMNIDLEVPDYTRVSRRGDVPKITCKLEKMEEPGHIIVDSSGIKVVGESEWLENKHGKQCKRKKWRKIHIGIDKNGMAVAQVMTDHLTDDRDCLSDLIKQANPTMITELIADPGYDSQETYDKLEALNIKTIIPPMRETPSKESNTTRQQTINYINNRGIHAWQNKHKYGRRAFVENFFFRFKEIIGRKLRAKKWNNQDAETLLGCHILNQFTKIGMPISVKL